MNYIATLPAFLMYFGAAAGLMGAFTVIYILVTPYREFRLIREGNLAAACSLLGALTGFAMPLGSAIANSVSLVDMLIWGAIALLVQLLVYGIVRRIAPELKEGIPAGVLAHGLFLGGSSVITGFLNAACMTY